ncbi:hypothetical protein AB0H73_15725 [Streptomyces olivoreticuli]|nr:hypothetical protein [Streptomyces olivoreticuli]
MFIQEWIKQEEEREGQRERCPAAVAASTGYDYPNPETFDRVRAAVSA